MNTVGIDTEQHLWRMPLCLRRPDDSGLALPAWPAPGNLLAAIVQAKGWGWHD